MNKTIKALCLLLAVFSLGTCSVACAQSWAINDKAFYDYYDSATGRYTNINSDNVVREIGSMKAEDFAASKKESDYILIKVKNYGSIVAVLRSDVAPITVANFKKLIKNKFFDGTVFHRVMEDFMIQGGGCTVEYDESGKHSTFVEKNSDFIYGEFTNNGFENNLHHVRGVLSMARTDIPNSASCQFFIVHQSNASTENLNNQYASFGYVLAGMDVVDAIATCEVVDADSNAPFPREDVIIESITFVEPKVALW